MLKAGQDLPLLPAERNVLWKYHKIWWFCYLTTLLLPLPARNRKCRSSQKKAVMLERKVWSNSQKSYLIGSTFKIWAKFYT